MRLTPSEARCLLPELTAALLTGDSVNWALRRLSDIETANGTHPTFSRPRRHRLTTRWNSEALSTCRAGGRTRPACSDHALPGGWLACRRHLFDVAMRDCRAALGNISETRERRDRDGRRLVAAAETGLSVATHRTRPH